MVNTYSDEKSFVRLGLKETAIQQEAKSNYAKDNTSIMLNPVEINYDVWNEKAFSNAGITNISHTESFAVNNADRQEGGNGVNLMNEGGKRELNSKKELYNE